MSSKTLIEVGMVAGVVTCVIIWYATGALWQIVPIGLGLWVAKLAKDALEKDSPPPAAPTKKGAKS